MAAKPPPKPEIPPSLVQVAGTQEQFQAAGDELAKKLGWEGEPNWVQNDIQVSDAWNFIVKTMHEHFQAGAKGEEQPSHLPACEHLALSAEADVGAVKDALTLAFEQGKDAVVTTVPKVTASLNAAMTMPVGEALGKLAQASGKAG